MIVCLCKMFFNTQKSFMYKILKANISCLVDFFDINNRIEISVKIFQDILIVNQKVLLDNFSLDNFYGND